VIAPTATPVLANELPDSEESSSLCKHCGRLISPTRLKRRLYCSERCKQDARLVRRGQKKPPPAELPRLPEPFQPEPPSLKQLAKGFCKPAPSLSTHVRILRITAVYMAALIIFIFLFVWLVG